jgi:tetratricopeptide (TPR) repeat protein
LNWSTSEGGNAEMGLQLAGGLWWFWVLRGYLTEGRAWLARALVPPGADLPTAARATALNAAGYLAIVHGETASARAPLEQSLALHHQLADERGIAMSLFGLGYAAYHGDDPSAARGYLEDSLARAEQASDRVVQHLVLVILGQVARRQGDLERAVDLNEQCLAIRRELGDLWGVGKALLNLGMLSRVQGDLARAHSQLAEGLALFQQFDDPRSCALTLSELCALAAVQCQGERAARLLGAADALVERLGMRWTPERTRINTQSLSSVRGLVGDAVVETNLAVGRALPLEEAIAEALAEAPIAAAAPGVTNASDEDQLTRVDATSAADRAGLGGGPGRLTVDDLDGAADQAAERCRALFARWAQIEERHFGIPALCWAATLFAARGDGRWRLNPLTLQQLEFAGPANGFGSRAAA